MSAEPIVYVNGEFVPQSQARISVLDHAVLYGDGIFETAVARNGFIFKLDAHIDRGFRSMAAIALPPPCDRPAMRDLVIETTRRNGLKDAYIKWLVTRGSNGRPLMDPTGCEPNLIIIVFAVVVIGGMGSIMGSILTGLGLGVIEGFTRVFYPEASATVVFVIMVIVLLLRPAGLFGKEK